MRVNIKCPLSRYSCTSFRYLDLQVTMSALPTRIFLLNWHFLHIIPTLFVFLITHLSKSSTNTTLGLHFCLFLPRVFHSYSGLLAFLILRFSKSFKWFIKITMCTWLTFNSGFYTASLSHVSITFATTSMPIGWIILCCGGDNVFYTLHKHKLKKTHAKIYTNTLNIHKSYMYIYIHKHTQ